MMHPTSARNDVNSLLEIATLEQVLDNDDINHPLSANALLKFSHSIFANENVEFLIDARQVMAANSTSSYRILVKRYGFCLNLPNEIQDRFLKGDPVGIKLATTHIFELVKTDIFPRFVKTIQIRKQLDYSRDSALWWKRPQSFYSFFSYPSSILTIDARCHSFICTVLIIAGALVFLSFNTDFGILFYLLYGYLARLICGPKLDPQSYFVIFIMRPVIVEYNFMDVLFENGMLHRVTQGLSAVLTIIALLLGFNDILIGFCTCTGVLGLFSAINALFGVNGAHFILRQLVKWNILPDKYGDKSNEKVIGIRSSRSRRKIDSVIILNE
eukprot:NODE_461_length_8173_cov_0.353604.p2 type:complete len:328 gc:universal NODE_461_length_8173_cov_0.353604:3950-2967(-)